MNQPTDRQVEEALRLHFARVPGGWMTLPDGDRFHTERQARDITRFCLMLGVPVSDVLSSTMFAKIVNTVSDLEDRVHAIELKVARS